MSRIPTGWKIDRLKDVAAINAGSLSASTEPDYELDYIEISNVDYHGIIDANAVERLIFEDAPSRARRIVRKGCTIISSVRPNLQAAAHVPDGGANLICSTGFNVVEPNVHKLFPKFAYYLLLSEGAKQYFEATATGVGYPAVGDKDFSTLQVMIPPLAEQQRIAAYLDASCKTIDAAVAAKRRQSELLERGHWSTIHTAITGEGNCEFEKKTANLPWLKEVPKHWKPRRIRDLAILSPSFSAKPPSIGEVYSVVPMECVSEDGQINVENLLPFEEISTGLTVFEAGDVLFAKITPCMENGKGAFVESLPTKYSFGSTEFHVLRPSRGILGRFLYYYTFNPIFRAYAAENMSGAAGQKRVSSRFLKDTRIFLPPFDEQKKIVKFLDERDQEYRSLSKLLEKQIEILNAYASRHHRSRLCAGGRSAVGIPEGDSEGIYPEAGRGLRRRCAG